MSTLPTDARTLDWALAYHDIGLCVLPAVPKTKKAAVPYKQYADKRPAREQVGEWYDGQFQNYSIAALMGEPSGGITARDFDKMPAYDRWATQHPDLAKLLPCSIGDRGRTVWARTDVSRIRSLSKTGAAIIAMSDGELRGGGLTILPPSIHECGDPYRWHVSIDFDRPIPTVDVVQAGFLDTAADSVNTEDTDTTDDTGKPKSSVSSVFSAHSVFSMFEKQLTQAVCRTIPPGYGKRQRKLFELARQLKAIPGIAELPVDQLEPVVRRWHSLAQKYIRTQPFIESWLDFKRAWSNVKYAAGTSAVDVAFQQAVKTAAPAAVAGWDSEPLVNLVKLCRELQRSRGAGQSFFLDCRTAGRLVGVVHSQAWQWLGALVDEGILELVAHGSRRERKANEYRYKLGD